MRGAGTAERAVRAVRSNSSAVRSVSVPPCIQIAACVVSAAAAVDFISTTTTAPARPTIRCSRRERLVVSARVVSSIYFTNGFHFLSAAAPHGDASLQSAIKPHLPTYRFIGHQQHAYTPRRSIHPIRQVASMCTSV